MTDENYWLPTEKNIEDYSLLIDMLDSQRKEFDILSKKKNGSGKGSRLTNHKKCGQNRYFPNISNICVPTADTYVVRF